MTRSGLFLLDMLNSTLLSPRSLINCLEDFCRPDEL